MYTFKPIKRDIRIESFMSCLDDIRPKGFDFSGEMHDFWEVVYLKSGCAIATADDRVYEITAGQLLFHKPLEFHRIRSAYDSAPHLLNISFTASGDRLKLFENAFFELNSEQQATFETINKKIGKIEKMHKNGEQNSKDYSAETTEAAVMLEKLLIELSETNEPVKNKRTENEKQYSNIISVLNDNCEDNFSVDDIAKLCEMSVSNLKRIFALYSDIGIAKYFLKLKLRRACELIVSGVGTTEIAERLGFSSTAYFNTVFKREMGITPAQFRKVRK